jgi:type III secretory pathway component EscT
MTSKKYFLASWCRANNPENYRELWIEMLAIKYLFIGFVIGVLLGMAIFWRK